MGTNILKHKRRCVAEILAAAVLDVCPDALILEGSETSYGFAYDFVFLNPFTASMLPFIEERMKKNIQDDIPIKCQEMVPDNAATFFRHMKRHFPALLAKEHKEALVQVFKMDQFVDLCPTPYLKSTKDAGHIKLIEIEERSPILYKGQRKKVIRIYGLQGEDAAALKQLKKHHEKRHEKAGIQSLLFNMIPMRKHPVCEEVQIALMPKGMQLKQELFSLWETLHKNFGFQLVQTQGEEWENAHYLCHKQLQKNRIAEYKDRFLETSFSTWQGFFSSGKFFFDKAHIFCKEEELDEELTSCLKLCEKTFKLFGFDCVALMTREKKEAHCTSSLRKALKESDFPIEEQEGQEATCVFYVKGQFEERRQSSVIEVKKHQKSYVIAFSLFGQIERQMAFLLEDAGNSYEKRMKDIAKKSQLK